MEFNSEFLGLLQQKEGGPLIKNEAILTASTLNRLGLVFGVGTDALLGPTRWKLLIKRGKSLKSDTKIPWNSETERELGGSAIQLRCWKSVRNAKAPLPLIRGDGIMEPHDQRERK